MNSIDNLREYVLTAPSICSTTRAILVGYIDGIEREVADMVPLPLDADGVPIHVGERVTCVLLFGGESEPFVVDRMELGRDGDGDVWSVALDRPTSCWEQPLLLRHHHTPTVEDMLREFVERLDEIGSEDDCVGEAEQECRACIRRDIAAVYAEYAAKLRLAEGEDE